jgi:hypothetical protein
VPDITHPFVSGIADGGDATLVRPSNWNAAHDWPTNTTIGNLTLADGDFAIHLYEITLATGELVLAGTAEISVFGWTDGKVYNVLGNPRSPRAPFRIPAGHDYTEVEELALIGEIEGFIEGDAELYIANFNETSETVLAGRTA